MRNLAFIALAMLLTACAQNAPIKLYEGAERSAAQVLTVRIPADLEVQTINGDKAPGLGGFGRDAFQTLHLQPGDYQIAAFYKGVFDVMGVNTEVVRSRIALFEISGQAGEVWTLDFTRPANLQEAQAMRKQFDAWATDNSGQKRMARQGSAPTTLVTQMIGPAAEPGASAQPYIQPLRAQSASTEPLWQPGGQASTLAASTHGASNAASYSAAQTPPAAGSALPHNDATLTTLKQLWQLLTPETRQAFLEWAK
jgi:uncharacterized protein